VLITNVQVGSCRTLVDVRCEQGLIAAIGPGLPRAGRESVFEGDGAALLPGLHDHHLHLFALAAQQYSVQCGPPAVCDREGLARVLREQRGAGWLRGVGYHESVAGALDRRQLDALLPDRPVKIQHRSGKLWIVNSIAARMLGLDARADMPGVERDSAGIPNGRLFRLDAWLREQQARTGVAVAPSLAGVSRLLASYGVTGVTDASPGNCAMAIKQFAAAVAAGDLLQNVRVMGGDHLPASPCPRVHAGERKVMLDEDALPDWDTLRAVFERAHQQGRAVAVHCVGTAELVLALSVLQATGVVAGDRIEHASLVPDDVLPLLREVGVRVVTQPGFIHERGDQYLDAVEPAEHASLYRCRALLAQGIPLAGSTDAPYGNPDPWAAMRAAVRRASRSGIAIGAAERLTPEQALALFTSRADDPGGASRRLAVGEAADLCLLDRGWEEARRRLRSEDVRATFRGGELIYTREQQLPAPRQHAAATA